MKFFITINGTNIDLIFSSTRHKYCHQKADKSSTIVIMNRKDYIAEVDRQLNDQTGNRRFKNGSF